MLRRRPIARMAVRTTAVVGTAAVVGGAVAHHQGQQQAAAAPPEPQAAPVEAAVADPYAQLKELGALHEQGVLTDAEFEAEKAKILG
jgi:hypothetical protein